MAKREASLRGCGYPVAALAVGVLLMLPAAAYAQRGWTAAEMVSGIATELGGLVTAADESGVATAAWREGPGPAYTVRAARQAPGEGWSTTVVLGTALFGADLAVAAAPAGGAIVLWTAGDAGVYASSYADSTGTWTASTVVAPRSGQYVRGPALAIDGAGNALALWVVIGRPHRDRPLRCRDRAVGPDRRPWQRGRRPDRSRRCRNAVAIWSDRSGLVEVLRARRFTVATGVWGPTLALASNDFVVALDLNVAPDGTAAALWHDADESPLTQSALSVALFSPSSGAWGPAAVLSRESSTGAVAVGSHEAMAVWTTGQGAMSSRSDLTISPGVWTSPVAIDATLTTPSGLFMSLAADRRGGFDAAWTVSSSGRASHYARSLAAWAPSVQLNASGVSCLGPVAAATASGTATVAWTGEVWPYRAVQAARWEATLAAPTLLTVSPNAGSLTIDFAAPGPTLAEYAAANVEYSLDGGGSWIPRAPPSPAPPIVISGLTDGTAYPCAPAADQRGRCRPGVAIDLATPGVGLLTPVGLRVSDVEGDLVTFTWDPPPIGGAPESYVVEGGLAPGATAVALDIGAAMPVFSVRLPAGAAYFVRVRAVILGRTTGPSNEVRASTDTATPPSAPAHLLGLVNGSALALSWTNTFEGGLPTSLWLVVSGPVNGAIPVGLVETFQHSDVPPGTTPFASWP
ncbi:MAG: fibronectin type III domain-containing protein [Vicinamibacterales bacterium]